MTVYRVTILAKDESEKRFFESADFLTSCKLNDRGLDELTRYIRALTHFPHNTE